MLQTRSSHIRLSAVVSALRRIGHPFAVSGLSRPSQKIESVFAASPETIRREPQEIAFHRSVGNLRDLAACALCDLVFSSKRGLSHSGAEAFCRYKWPLFAIYSQQIRHHFSIHRNGFLILSAKIGSLCRELTRA